MSVCFSAAGCPAQAPRSPIIQTSPRAVPCQGGAFLAGRARRHTAPAVPPAGPAMASPAVSSRTAQGFAHLVKPAPQKPIVSVASSVATAAPRPGIRQTSPPQPRAAARVIRGGASVAAPAGGGSVTIAAASGPSVAAPVGGGSVTFAAASGSSVSVPVAGGGSCSLPVGGGSVTIPAAAGGSVSFPAAQASPGGSVTVEAAQPARAAAFVYSYGGSTGVRPRLSTVNLNGATSPVDCRSPMARVYTMPQCSPRQAGSFGSPDGGRSQPTLRARACTVTYKTNTASCVSLGAAKSYDAPSVGGSVSTAAGHSLGSASASTSTLSLATRPIEPSRRISTATTSLPTEASTESGASDGEEDDKLSVQVIAFKNNGAPLIWRQTDEESGVQQTIVEREDGSTKAFGAATMSSIEHKPLERTVTYTRGLNDLELRAFAHEVGERLSHATRLYSDYMKELEELFDAADRAFFGISKDATKKELDRAYRKLAKTMHPDKNGGTDSAKQAFQAMFERYKRLRLRCKESVDESEVIMNYVDRILLRECIKEDRAIRSYVNYVCSRAVSRIGDRAAIDCGDEAVAPAPQEVCNNAATAEAPKRTPQSEEFSTRAYLESQVKNMVNEYKKVRSTLPKLERDIQRLRVSVKTAR